MPSDLRALTIFRNNVRTILDARKESQAELARTLKHSPSWINKFLNGERQIQMKDLDRIALFLGIAPYQLFQPGISLLTERRIQQRRRHDDRRIGHQARHARELGAQIKAHRPNVQPALRPEAMQEFAALAAQLNQVVQELADLQNVGNQPASKKKSEKKAG